MGHYSKRIKSWRECRQEIGEKIKDMRLELDLSPETAAEILHIGTKHLFWLENGDIRKMEFSYLHSIAYKYSYKLKISFEKR